MALKRDIRRNVTSRLSAGESPEAIAENTPVPLKKGGKTLEEKIDLFHTLKVDLAAVVTAIQGVHDLLRERNLTSDTICERRSRLIPSIRFQNGFLYPKRSQPHFLDFEYPAIPLNWDFAADSEMLGVMAGGDAEKILDLGTRSCPIARYLLAYIWKQGAFSRLHHVARGILNSPSGSATDVEAVGNNEEDSDETPDDDSGRRQVLVQFGRHLRDRIGEPIVDQHTYRAFQVLEYGTYVPSSAKNLTNDRIAEYKGWWEGKILPLLALDKKKAAIDEFDKLLFSLGKAIALFPGADFKKSASRSR